MESGPIAANTFLVSPQSPMRIEFVRGFGKKSGHTLFVCQTLNHIGNATVTIFERSECEKTYEISLRRIGMHKHDFEQSGFTQIPNQQKAANERSNQSIQHNILYHSAVQSLQNYCLSKADQIKRSSVVPTEILAQTLSEQLKRQEKATSMLLKQGDELVEKIQQKCLSLTTIGQRTEKVEQKQSKSNNILTRFFNTGSKQSHVVSQSYQEKQEDSKKKLEAEHSQLIKEQQKVIHQSTPMRQEYVQRMTDTIDSIEKVMRQNIDSISNCITEFSGLNKKHMEELIVITEKLSKEVLDMQLQLCLDKHLFLLPEFDKQRILDFVSDQHTVQGSSTETSKGQTPGEPDTPDPSKQQQSENEFFQNLQNDINKLILSCWEGYKLKEEDRRIFRHLMRFNKGQWIFINLLNQFRIKNIHSMTSQEALMSISELIKIVLDEILVIADTYVAVNCLLLSSTFYFNPASQGGQNTKKFLFELISDHRIWQDIDFWERAITQQIQKDLNTTLDANIFEKPEEKQMRFNEVVFAIISSLQQEMLTYNIPKDIIKTLVNKICRNSAGFPEIYLTSILEKIDDYVPQPTQLSVQLAKQYMHEPGNDPLFLEETKKTERKSVQLSSNFFQDVGGRKQSEMSSNNSNSAHNFGSSASPSPKNDQGSNAKKKVITSFVDEEEKKQGTNTVSEGMVERVQQSSKFRSIDETDQQHLGSAQDENLEFVVEQQTHQQH